MSEISDWIRLTATPGVGPAAAHKLLQVFGLPEKIFQASYAHLKQFVSDKQAQLLHAPPSAPIAALIKTSELWSESPGQHIITLADREYPKQLLSISSPPTLLYVKGKPNLLSHDSVAVVGSRNASTQGIIHARQFSEALSQSGITIISGLAAGIDAAAHEGGLSGPSSTVAVIGTGIDLVYPSSNKKLALEIADQGCLISEYPLGTPAIAHNFPRRNRIISGLSLGVLVVEAAEQSGSLITARQANEQGRDVFAIPGSIHSPFSKGCHSLIKQGAKLVDTAQDIIEELKIMRVSSPRTTTQSHPTQDPASEDQLLNAIGFDPVHPDELAIRSCQTCPDITAKLLMLELEGEIEMLAGGFYQRVKR